MSAKMLYLNSSVISCELGYIVNIPQTTDTVVTIHSTPTDLQRRSNSLSSLLAAEIHRHLRHKFNPNIAAVKK